MKKILSLVFIIIIIFIIVIFFGSKPAAQPQPQNPPSQNDSPRVTSTKPDPLDNAVISADEVVEITFNKPLQNIGEFKVRIDGQEDYKVELSPDRKTARIIPTKPYNFGTSYTLFIGPDTKFDGVGNWGQEKVYHFRTIRYTGV